MDGWQKMNTDERSAKSGLRDIGRRASSRALRESSDRMLPFKLHLPVAVQTSSEQRRCVLCSFLKETNGSRSDPPKSGVWCKGCPDGESLCVYGDHNCFEIFHTVSNLSVLSHQERLNN